MISVCIATHNGEKYIKKQLESILIQLCSDDEVIISDDGSTDDTINIINSLNDSRIKIKYFKNSYDKRFEEFKTHQLATNNFENAINNAQGDFIFLSDQDDVWYPNKVKKTIELFNQYDMVLHNYSIIDKDDNMLFEKKYQKSPVHKTLIMNCIDNHFRGCCLAYKKNFSHYFMPFPKNIIGHDYWIGTILRHYCRFMYYLNPLLYYRVNTESVTFKLKRKIFSKIYFRIHFFIKIIQRICYNKVARID